MKKELLSHPIFILFIMLIFLVKFPLPVWGADHLVFSRAGNVWIAATDGTGEQQLTYSGKDSTPVISPDGRLVSFVTLEKKGGHRDRQIFVVPATGGTPQKFSVPGVQQAFDPSFSPNSNSLVFLGISHLHPKDETMRATVSIWIANLKTGKTRRVVQKAGKHLIAGYVFASPSVSPDGQRLVYREVYSDVSMGFLVADLKGCTLFQFPPGEAYREPHWDPIFSPDSKQILCNIPPDGPILLVDLATQQKRVIQEKGAKAIFVDQGRAIVFERWSGRWSGVGETTCDLWRLDLAPGSRPRKIIANASFSAN